MPATRIAVVLFIVAVAAPIAMADVAGPAPIRHEPTIVWYRGGFAPDARFDDVFEAIVASRIGESSFVYEYPTLVVAPLVQLAWSQDGDGRVTYYSFRALLCLGATAIDNLIGGKGFWPPPEVADPRWWTVLLHAPNSSFKYRLSRGLRLSLTTRTDLLPLRIHGGDQGILFTPQIGLEWVGLSSGFEHERIPLTNRLHVGVGYANWWSFEGRGRTPGWTFVVGVGFMAGV